MFSQGILITTNVAVQYARRSSKLAARWVGTITSIVVSIVLTSRMPAQVAVGTGIIRAHVRMTIITPLEAYQWLDGHRDRQQMFGCAERNTVAMAILSQIKYFDSFETAVVDIAALTAKVGEWPMKHAHPDGRGVVCCVVGPMIFENGRLTDYTIAVIKQATVGSS